MLPRALFILGDENVGSDFRQIKLETHEAEEGKEEIKVDVDNQYSFLRVVSTKQVHELIESSKSSSKIVNMFSVDKD